MKVALVHDYLTQRGGAERVVLAMLRAFPGVPVHTSLYDPDGTFPAFAAADVRTLAIDRVPGLRRHHRAAFPLLAPAFAAHRVEADVVLCSSSGWAHGVRAGGAKVVYCYTPARWLYRSREYAGSGSRPLVRAAMAVGGPPLRRWDRRAAAGAARYLTLSTAVRDRIRAAYGIDAEVLAPPPALGPEGPSRPPAAAPEPGFLLCVARLLPYKNVDAVVEAFAALPHHRLVVAGAGPDLGRVARRAGANVTLLGTVPDDELRWLYGACAAVVSASHEDFGLTPLEAAAFAKPAAVLRGGGFLDTVVEGETGLYFDLPDPASIAPVIEQVAARDWPASLLLAQARRFGEERFATRLREVVAEAGGAAGTVGRAGGGKD